MSRTVITSVPGRFTPLQLSGLQAWYDAADNNTLYDATSGGSLVVNGGTVARWEDKSGNLRHLTQSSAGARPTWSTTGGITGRNALIFTAANSQFLSAADPLTSSSDFTICWVGFGIWGRGLDGFGAGWSIQPGAVVLGGSAYTVPVTAYLSCSIMRLQQNVELTSYTNGVVTTTSIPGVNTLRTSTIGFEISRAGSASTFFNNNWSEHIIYNRVLSLIECAQMTAYLVSKWNYRA